MARKTPKSRRHPATSRMSVAATAGRPGATDERHAAETATTILDTSYPHVRRDLLRIAILGAAMFGLIFASPLLLH